MFKIQNGNVVYYYSNKEKFTEALSDLKDSKDSQLSLLLTHAEVAINIHNNTVIKCRPGLDLYFDYFFTIRSFKDKE